MVTAHMLGIRVSETINVKKHDEDISKRPVTVLRRFAIGHGLCCTICEKMGQTGRLYAGRKKSSLPFSCFRKRLEADYYSEHNLLAAR